MDPEGSWRGVSVKQKRDHSSRPVGTPSHAKGKSQWTLQTQKGIFGVCSQHSDLGLSTVSLAACVGSASGTGAGRRRELLEKWSSEK